MRVIHSSPSPSRLGEDPLEDFRLPPEVVATMEADKVTRSPLLIPRPPNYPYRKVPFSTAQLKVVAELSLDQAQLSSHERTRLERVLREHSAAFAQDETDLGQTLLLEHEIDTQGLPLHD